MVVVMTVAREVVLIGEKIWVETIRHSQGIIMTIANHSYKRVNARKILEKLSFQIGFQIELKYVGIICESLASTHLT